MLSRKVSRILMLSLLVLSATYISADEGMWPLYDLDKLPFDSLRARGLMLEPQQIYKPKGGGISDAVVRVGASGSFVSPQGLIVTNHHVAFGAIQRQSTVERNLLRDGFYAATRDEEIPAIGYNVYVTLSVEDVTKRVLDTVDDAMSDLERYKAIDRAIKEIIRQAEADRDVKCRVAKMFGGKQYVLYTRLKIRDVRIVYVPPASIGRYGGDIDNWIWPRHTGDFSFLRAYVGPDGRSAAYAKENVPYQPKVYLPISSAGVREDDFTMIIGFPGGTSRYASSYEIDNLVSLYYPWMIRTIEDELAIIQKASAEDSSVAIRLASWDAGINNALKNSYGMMEGFTRASILDERRHEEQSLTEFLAANPGLQRRYGRVLPELDSLYRERRKTQQKDRILGWLNYSSDLLAMASNICKWAEEREKEDIERERGYQDRDTISTKRWLRDAQINLVPSVDKEMLRYFLGKSFDLPPDQRIDAVDRIFAGKTGQDRETYLQEFLDNLFDKTRLADVDQRMLMFGMSRDELERLNDSFIEFAMALKPERDEQRERRKEFSGALSRLEPRLIQAYAEWKGDELYPDANGTMRLNCGSVKGYRPRDAVNYNYLTGLSGVIEKETGLDPFVVPEKLKQAYAGGDFRPYVDPVTGDIPVNFLTTNDATGGNSGSPVLNGKGELIGLLFDGNYESIVADYLFDRELTRSIVVDIRYVLFLIDKVYHLENLLEELTIH